jgi:hypothetical protein
LILKFRKKAVFLFYTYKLIYNNIIIGNMSKARRWKKEVSSNVDPIIPPAVPAAVRTPTPTMTSFKVDTWEDYESDEDLVNLGRV